VLRTTKAASPCRMILLTIRTGPTRGSACFAAVLFVTALRVAAAPIHGG